MKKLLKDISQYRKLAIALSVVLLGFSLFVFYSQSSSKSNLERAKITEILQLEDDQGLIYQNLLVRIISQDLTLNVKVPVNLPEVRGLEKGDIIYLQQIGSEDYGIEYRYTSSDRTSEFLIILVIFVILIFVVLGVKPAENFFPAVVFLTLLVAGVFSLSSEVRYVFLSILGFMTILTFISILWFFEDMILSMLASCMMAVSLVFCILLNTILIEFTNSSENIRFIELFSKQSLINDFSQAKLLVIMIFTYGLLLYVFIHLIRTAKEFLAKGKKVSKEKLIKHCVDTVQKQIGHLLNLIFFLALGLNFLGLISEDYSIYKYIWNNSFFLSVVIDGVVAASSLIVGGFIMALFVSLYLAKHNTSTKNEK